MSIEEFIVRYFPSLNIVKLLSGIFLNPAIAGFYLQQPIFILSHKKTSANKNSKVFVITKIDL